MEDAVAVEGSTLNLGGCGNLDIAPEFWDMWLTGIPLGTTETPRSVAHGESSGGAKSA